MKHVLALIACTAVLASCDKSSKVDEKDASVTEVAQKVRKAGADQAFIQPGLWESKVTIDKFEVPGMPADVQQRMKTMMAEQQEHASRNCLTKEDVQRPKEDFFTGKNNECRYEHFKMGDGKIDAALQCAGGGMKQTMQMAGTYSPDTYQMQMSANMQSGEETQAGMNMQMRVEAKRVGDCKA